VITVAKLNIYPIKSTAGFSPFESTLETRGFCYDRRMALVNASSHKIITARESPTLLGIQTRISGSHWVANHSNTSLTFPLLPQSNDISLVTLFTKAQYPGIRYPDKINRWFSSYLGIECYLIYMGKDCQRDLPQNTQFGYKNQNGDTVSYADDYPLLIVSEASLGDLNVRIGKTIPMHRFRPNIVLSGCAAYEDDLWQRIRIGECELEFAQPCTRCVITTIDQETYIKDEIQEPLRTLATYRRTPEGRVKFGTHWIPRGLGKIKVGDTVKMLQTSK